MTDDSATYYLLYLITQISAVQALYKFLILYYAHINLNDVYRVCDCLGSFS